MSGLTGICLLQVETQVNLPLDLPITDFEHFVTGLPARIGAASRYVCVCLPLAGGKKSQCLLVCLISSAKYNAKNTMPIEITCSEQNNLEQKENGQNYIIIVTAVGDCGC